MIDIPSCFFLKTEDTPFPAVKWALKNPNGLIAIGGTLSNKRLLDAYSKGIFPWYGENEPVLWYSPNPRMIMTKDTLHVAKSLKKIIKSNRFHIKVDTDFKRVINFCKESKRKEQSGTWIDEQMLHAYTRLHVQGFARSVEVYENNRLVGGLYGVVLGKVFFGESMFSLVSNASKVALVYLLERLDYAMVDCQVESPHLKSLGAFNVSRNVFVSKLQELL